MQKLLNTTCVTRNYNPDCYRKLLKLTPIYLLKKKNIALSRAYHIKSKPFSFNCFCISNGSVPFSICS